MRISKKLNMMLKNSTTTFTWMIKPTNGKKKANKKPNLTGKNGNKTDAHAEMATSAIMTMALEKASANHVEDTKMLIAALMMAFQKLEPVNAQRCASDSDKNTTLK